MFSLYAVATPRDQDSIFDGFDPDRATWLVSDLRSKLDLNRRLLQNRNYVPGDSVLRASELWRKLLGRTRPDLQVISKEFALTLIGQKLAKSGLDWVQAPGAGQTTLDYMTQFMPILAHPEGEAIMAEWLTAHPESHARWGRWFDLSLKMWREFLTDGFLAPQWASGVLVNETGLREVWSRPLFVDLGAELDQVEADLLVQLSEFNDVTVIKPEPSWIGDYPKALLGYDIFEQKLKVERHVISSVAPRIAPREFRKYTTMIAEVKASVAQIRQWLDQGAKPNEVAIVAPDIECYWPALSSYLQEEGIPTQKNQVRRLHAYPDVARFLANLRLRTGSFNESDIELSLFDPESGSTSTKLISYDRFKTLYGTLYSREDMQRANEVESKFAIELQPSDEVARDEFVTWSLRQLPAETELSRVESLFKQLFQEVPQAMRLTVKRWLAYLEQLSGKIECRISDGDPDGVAILNLTSADNSPANQMMILGLTENSLKKGGGTSVLLADIMSLAQQFGFHLASEDHARLEFEARWITQDCDRELILCVPETDFGGAAQAPSWLWIKGSREYDQGKTLSVPEPTRWDELQKADLTDIATTRRWAPGHRTVLERAFREDLGEVAYEPFGTNLVSSLSPSGIEDYLNCPFMFAAKRLMGLSDIPELDLEVDPSRRGSLMHKLFELLTVEPIKFDLSNDELGVVVDNAREQSHLELADERLWPPLRSRHIDLGRRFLDFEKQAREKFPETKVLGSEVDIAGYIRIATGELVATPEPNTIKFQGRIDRIDTDARGNLAIYDYKSSASTATQFGAWCRNNRIQLLLYAMAVENGLTRFPANPVQSAIYYVARPFSRDNGFKVEDVQQGLFDTEDRRKKNRLTQEQKAELFEQGRALVKKAIDGIESGRFDPSPRDHTDCPTCQWSAVCRAPHLNS